MTDGVINQEEIEKAMEKYDILMLELRVEINHLQQIDELLQYLNAQSHVMTNVVFRNSFSENQQKVLNSTLEDYSENEWLCDLIPPQSYKVTQFQLNQFGEPDAAVELCFYQEYMQDQVRRDEVQSYIGIERLDKIMKVSNKVFKLESLFKQYLFMMDRMNKFGS